jgi:4-amino-4-deoxy-L-arabinose transferase-like glycosyltransferase
VHFWVITTLTYLFGYQSLWPFVLQSLVSYIALLLVVRSFARELFGDDAGPPSMFVLATSMLMWGLAQTARMDLSFTLFITIAALSYWRFVVSRNNRQLYLAALMIAIAILLKGPMAFVMGALLAIFYAIWRRRAHVVVEKNQSGSAKWWIAFLIVLTGPLLWLVPALMRGGKQYANDLLIKQNVGRALNAWTHKEPFWYYLERAPLTMHPWFVLLVIALIAIWKRPRNEEERPAVAFALCWIAAVVVPFSMLSSKLDVYMLPALPPIAMLIGQFLGSKVEDRYSRAAVTANRIVVLLLLFIAALVAFIPRLAQSFPEAVEKVKPEFDLLAPALPLFGGVTALLLVIAFLFTLGRSSSLIRSSIALGLSGLASLVVATLLLMPQVNEVGSTRPLIATLAKSPLPPEQIALFACPNLWTRDMPPRLFGVRYVGEDILETDPATLPPLVVSRSSRAKELGDSLRLYDHVETVRMIGKDFYVYRRR